MADQYLITPRGNFNRRALIKSESRVIRERQDGTARKFDREPASRRFTSARQLLQIYNGGAIGAAAELYYLGHPVLVTGTEVEGGAAVLTVDDTVSVPVVVLRGVPAVNDYLPAYTVGGRWVGEKKGGCAVKFDVKCDTTAIPGATVTITSGGLAIATGATNSSGQITLDLGSAGTYTVTVTATGFGTYSQSSALTCGETFTDIDLCAVGSRMHAVRDPQRRFDDLVDECPYWTRLGYVAIHRPVELENRHLLRQRRQPHFRAALHQRYARAASDLFHLRRLPDRHQRILLQPGRYAEMPYTFGDRVRSV